MALRFVRARIALFALAVLVAGAKARAENPPLFVNVDRIATMNADGVRAELEKAGWKKIKKDKDGLDSKKPDGSSVNVDMSRGKVIRVVAWLAPPFPAPSPDLFRSVLGISATPPPPDPDGTGGSLHRGGNLPAVILRWNQMHPVARKSFGPVYAAEIRRTKGMDGSEECVVIVELVDHATMKKWINAG